MKSTLFAIILIIIALVIGAYTGWKLGLYENLGFEGAAVLSLRPNKASFSTTSPFQIEVWVNTRNKPVDGTDVFLSFNPKMLEAADISFDKGVFPNTPARDFILRQGSTGMLRFSALVEPGSSFTGQGKIATITFKPTGKGATSVEFVFEKRGSTVDSNVGYHGQDMLGRVVNGSYNLVDHVK
jgi:hypothetical protein